MFGTLVLRPAGRKARRPLDTAVALESLEGRVVLSAVTAPLVTITSVTVDDVRAVDDQLVATATVVGTALGRNFTQEVQVPLQLSGTPGQEGSCDVLNLTLGPLDLNVLGLKVSLDDCAGGPITVDITGNDAPGNLLGNLVCDVAGLLDQGVPLGDVLNGLDVTDPVTGVNNLTVLTSGLTDLANDVIGRLADGLGTAEAGQGGGASHRGDHGGGNVTDVLNLHLGPLDLDVLGLEVRTSEICLDVTAERGGGKLLGNLVGSIAHLLDKDPGNAINALSARLDRVLGQVSDELLVGDREA